MIAEVGIVFLALAVFGYFVHGSAKKEREEVESGRRHSESPPID